MNLIQVENEFAVDVGSKSNERNISMSKITITVFAFILMTVVGNSSSHALDCENALTTRDMIECADQSFKAADGDLNFSYQNAIRQMKDLDANLSDDLSGAEESLRRAQRAWIKYKDLACEANGFLMRGGSFESVIIISCLERLTRKREEELRILWEVN